MFGASTRLETGWLKSADAKTEAADKSPIGHDIGASTLSTGPAGSSAYAYMPRRVHKAHQRKVQTH